MSRVLRVSFYNVYGDRTGNERLSRRAADNHAGPDRLAVVRIALHEDGTVSTNVLPAVEARDGAA